MQGLDVSILVILVFCPVFLFKLNMYWVSTTAATRVPMLALVTMAHPCHGHLVYEWGRKEFKHSILFVRKYTHFVAEKAKIALKFFSLWK